MINFTDKQAIVDFLSGKGTDYKGRSYVSMLNWSDFQLEECHDQIQWFFPLHEESKFAIVCPIITKGIIDELAEGFGLLNAVQCNLVKAKFRMDEFFGIGKYKDRNKQRRWCRNRNHNLLRITRIIRSLRIFRLDDEAQEVYDDAFEAGVYFGIDAYTLSKWEQALKSGVWDTLKD